MTYLILDPPVNPFSPRSKIEAWVARLEALSTSPEFSAGPGRKEIETALRDAHSWLETSNDPAPDPAPRVR